MRPQPEYQDFSSTNLYMANVPLAWTEADLQQMLCMSCLRLLCTHPPPISSRFSAASTESALCAGRHLAPACGCPPLIFGSRLCSLCAHPPAAHGKVVSARILRDMRGISRGVGFARMETREQSEAIIRHFGQDWIMPGCVQPLQVG